MSVEKRGTKALEYWAKKATQGYPGVSIDNMTTSWRDGRAFCALIHHFRPDLIDFDSLKAENILENNALAYKTAEQHLGIPALLDAEDMVSCAVPDRLSILTYVSQYYQTLATQGILNTPKKESIVTQNSKNSSKNSSPLTPQKTTPSLAASRTKPSTQVPVMAPKKESEFKTDKVAGGGFRLKREECYTCRNPVYLAEKILVGDPIQLLHRTCFKCARCSSQLTLSNYYVTEKSQFCCETCPDEEKSLASNGTRDSKAQEDSDSDDDSEASDSSEDSDKSHSKTDETTVAVKPRTVFLQQTVDNDCASNGTAQNETIPSTITQEGPTKPPRIFAAAVSSESDAKAEEIVPPATDTEATSPGIVSDRLKIFENKSHVQNATDDHVLSSIYPKLKDQKKKEEHNTKESSLDDNEEVDVKENSVTTVEVNINMNDEIKENEPVETDIEKQNQLLIETREVNDVPETETIEKIERADDDEPKTDIKNIDNEENEKEIEKSESSEMVHYPDDLNPFGTDDEDEITTEPKEHNKSVCPKLEITKSASSEKIQPSLNPFGSDEDDVEEEINEKKNLNPFLSDDEEEPKPKPKPPRPPPPTLKRNEAPLSLTIQQTSSVPASPSLSYRSLTPAGLRIKKKQKPAPTPPGRPVSSKIEKESHDSEVPDEILSMKLEKNKQNMSRMNSQTTQDESRSTKKVIPAPKFEKGEWRRKKGPAPPRPVPQKRAIRKIPMSHVQQELKDIDLKQTQLERQGVLLETAIRNKTEAEPIEDSNPMEEAENSPGVEVEDMILQLFELVNEKNELFRRQTELMYLKRERRLEEEHAELEYQIRCLMMKPSKTTEDNEREEELISRLMKVVEQRDQIVNCLELERQREAVEDESIANHMIKYQEKYIDGVETPDEDKLIKKKKKRKLKLLTKKKKKKSKEEKSSKMDDDKDIDETEQKPSKNKKKHWFKKVEVKA